MNLIFAIRESFGFYNRSCGGNVTIHLDTTKPCMMSGKPEPKANKANIYFGCFGKRCRKTPNTTNNRLYNSCFVKLVLLLRVLTNEAFKEMI